MNKKIKVLLLTMFGIGYSKYAPGTVASFSTCLIYIFLFYFNIDIIFIVFFVVFIFFFSIYSIEKIRNIFKQIDASEIVIDEFIGQSIPVITIYYLVPKQDYTSFLFYVLISFVLFRIFDIFKIYPANIVDKNIKNGLGVMLDDVIAGFYAAIILLIINFYI